MDCWGCQQTFSECPPFTWTAGEITEKLPRTTGPANVELQ